MRSSRLRILFQRIGLIASSSAMSVATPFARNIIIARLAGPADFGVAVMIATIAAAADLLSDLGWDKYLIRSSDTDHLKLQSVIHYLRVRTGLMVSAIILVAAPFLARGLGVPQSWPAFSLIALVTMIRSFYHADYRHRQKNMDFKGETIVEASRNVADLATAITVAIVFRSYWAMTSALLVGAVVGCVASHLLAGHKYKQTWEPVVGRDALKFGTPLFVNNIIVYAASQGDRLLVGFSFSPSILAIYAASLSLISGPQVIISKILVSYSLPVLARNSGDPVGYARAHRRLGAIAVIATAVISFPLIVFGSTLVLKIFGTAFAPDPSLVAALVIPQSINVIRTWSVCGLMANSKTRIIPLVNMTRLVGLVLAVLFVLRSSSITTVAYCLAVGELAGLLAVIVAHSKYVSRIDLSSMILIGTLLAGWGVVGELSQAMTGLPAMALLAVLPILILTVIAVLLETVGQAKSV